MHNAADARTILRGLMLVVGVLVLAGCSAAVSTDVYQRATIDAYLKEHGGPKCVPIGWDSNSAESYGVTSDVRETADRWGASVPDGEPAPQPVATVMRALTEAGLAGVSRHEDGVSYYVLTDAGKKLYYNSNSTMMVADGSCCQPRTYLCFQHMRVAKLTGMQQPHEETADDGTVHQVMRVRFTWEPGPDETPNSDDLRAAEVSTLGDDVVSDDRIAIFQGDNDRWNILTVDDYNLYQMSAHDGETP